VNIEDFERISELFSRTRTERRRLNDNEVSELARIYYPYTFFGRFDATFAEDWNRRAEVDSFVNAAMERELFGNYDIRNRLADLAGVPTLVLVGAFDLFTPPPVVKSIAERIPGARLEVFDRSGHYLYVEEHDKFIRTVSEFLKGSP
jgi:pimeloyl-ACP methyl ester carboxylesterase